LLEIWCTKMMLKATTGGDFIPSGLTIIQTTLPSVPHKSPRPNSNPPVECFTSFLNGKVGVPAIDTTRLSNYSGNLLPSLTDRRVTQVTFQPVTVVRSPHTRGVVGREKCALTDRMSSKYSGRQLVHTCRCGSRSAGSTGSTDGPMHVRLTRRTSREGEKEGFVERWIG
jgi:hypothetical protein